MDEEFDHFRYRYCIVFVLGHNYLHTKAYDVDGYFEFGSSRRSRTEYVPSFVYDTTSKTLLAEGELADELMRKTKEPQNNLLYIPNVFTELRNTYIKQQEDHCEQNWFNDVVIQEVIKILQMQVDQWKEQIDCPEAELCYAFTIPAGWNDNTKEEVIRPLFVKSGLLHEDDDVHRLNLFTDLELTFRYMQSKDHDKPIISMKQGHQYVIMSLDLQQELHVDLKLVSTQYPGLKTVDSGYTPQLLKDFHFKIPFGSHDVKSSLITCCRKNFCDSKLVLTIIDQMLETLEDEFGKSKVKNSSDLLSYLPFFEMDLEYCHDSKYSKKELDLMLDNIRSLTVEDVFEDWFHSFVKEFMNGMNTLLQGTDQIKAKYLVVFYTEFVKIDNNSNAVMKLFKRWVKTFIEQQNSPFTLIPNSRSFVYDFDSTSKMGMVDVFIKKQMNDFNISRDPIILPTDSSNEEYENSLKPVYFINIDLLPKQNKITLTYVDSKSQVKRTENIGCNIQPWDTFFKQSESYQRPHLRISNRLKLQLEKMFAECLIMHSKSERRKPSSRLLKPASELLNRVLRKVKTKSVSGNYLRIKNSRHRTKEIRNFLASSSPHLLEQVMQNVKTDDLFMENNSSCSDDTNLLDTSDPGYILFFIIAYLHNLNKLLNKELDKTFGNDWRGKNRWYGVSVDKHLLETVFMSKKKLEKLFYASGILVKDNNLRRAKFCVHGEEILPAIQQILDLKLKMKSYFVVAHIFPQHVQLTLHQTVKLASPGEDAATIIIEDKIVYFGDVHDELCKNIWKKMQSNCQIDYCITHKDKKYTDYDFGSFQAYRDIRQTLKQRIVELLKNDSQNVDMNLCTKLNVNKTCSCHMVISLRLVIEKGLQPVIESIVRMIAATLTNYDIFGNYKTDYIFVFGDPFNLSYGSHFYGVYNTILQRTMDDGITLKEKDTQAFVMKNSLRQLIDFSKRIKPHMFDRFIHGTLCQVPNNTYGIQISLESYCWFARVNRNGDIKTDVERQCDYLIFIEKEKPLSTKGTLINIMHDEEGEKISFDATIIRASNPCNAKLKKHDILDKTANGTVESTTFVGKATSVYDLIVECKHLNYSYSLEITLRNMAEHRGSYGYFTKFRVLGEPLTLAYI